MDLLLLILSSRNCGFAGGNNIGVKYAVDTLKQLNTFGY